MYLSLELPIFINFFHKTRKLSPVEKNISDDQCMKMIAKGQEESFQILFKRYGGLVLGYCQRLLADRSQAEDASQEVWVKVIRAAEKYKGSGKCKAWILQITRNTCFSVLRKQKSFVIDEAEEESIEDLNQEDVLTLMEKEQGRDNLRKIIDQLPNSQRVALMLWMTEEKSYQEIAQEMLTSESAVKSLIFRARQSIKSSLGGSHE